MLRKIFSLLLILSFAIPITPVYAVVDSLSAPNNKFGIHIISATKDEASAAAALVNSSGGDWGYITVVIQSNDREKDKWQDFFNLLRRYHLIPIVRLATHTQASAWVLPKEEDAKDWAQFLDGLRWPTKNRYVVIYNEPNHTLEWGGNVNPASYAQVLNDTINALKEKSDDFFVLNAGFDASAPHQPPNYFDQEGFMLEMENAVPGIFTKLDGWVSHSYPNPGFVGSPAGFGRGTIRTFLWEQSLLTRLGVDKDLPVFITETGWKHAEGINYDNSLPASATVGEYFKVAFNSAWNYTNIIAITPFLLDYQEPLFAHFSFKKPASNKDKNFVAKVLGAEADEYYPQYRLLESMAKAQGLPAQIYSAVLINGTIYPEIVEGETYTIPLTFRNTGQSIWNDNQNIEIRATSEQPGVIIEDATEQRQKVEPDGTFSVLSKIKALKQGNYKISLNLFHIGKSFENQPFDFEVSVKQPVILKVKSKLLFKNSSLGEYFLNNEKLIINDEGLSNSIEARQLLPGSTYTFTIKRPFYLSKTVTATVYSGENLLDFGTLMPDFLRAILKPRELWKLLPFTQ